MGNPFLDALNVVQRQEEQPVPSNEFLAALTPTEEQVAETRLRQEQERQLQESQAAVEFEEQGRPLLSTLRNLIFPTSAQLTQPASIALAREAADRPPTPTEAGAIARGGITQQDASTAIAEAARAAQQEFQEPLAFRAFAALPESVREAATSLSESLEDVTIRVPDISPRGARFGLPQPLEEVSLPVTPFVSGVARLPVELTSPQNLAILGGLGLGVGALGLVGPVVGPVLQAAAKAGLSGVAIKSALERSPEFVQAAREGRTADAAELAGGILTEAAFGAGLLRSARGSIRTAAQAARANAAAGVPVRPLQEALPPSPPGVEAPPPVQPALPRPIQRLLPAPQAEPPPIPLPGEVAPTFVPGGLGTRIRPPGGPFPLPSVTPIPLAEAAAIQGQPLEGGAPVSARPASIEPLTPRQQAGALRTFRGAIRGPDIPPDLTAEGEVAFREALAPSAARLRTPLGEQVGEAAGVSGAALPTVAQAAAPPFDFDERVGAFAEPEVEPVAPPTTAQGRAQARRARNRDPEAGFTRFSNIPPQEEFVPEEIGNLNKKRSAPQETPIANIADVARNKGRAAIRNVVDRFTDIRRLGDAARKRDIEVEPHKDPGNVFDIVTGGVGGLQQEVMLRVGDVKFAAEQAGIAPQVSAILDLKGFQRAFQTLEENAVRAEQEAASIRQAVGEGGEAPEAAELLRAAREAREKVSSGKAVPQGYTPEKVATDLAAIRTTLGTERFTEAENLANAVFDLNAESLEFIRDTGLISGEAFNTLSARGREFIPLERILDDAAEASALPPLAGAGSKLTLAQQTVIKRLRGSELPTVDPYEASLRRFSRVLSEGSRNVAAKTLVRFGTEIDPEGFGQSVRRLREGESAGKEEGIISFLENGSRQRWAVPLDIADAMGAVNPLETEIVGGALLRFGQTLARTTLTSGNLAFGLVNVGRDVQRAATISGEAAKSPADFLNFITLQWGQALKDTVLQSPEFREFLKSGAAFSTLQRQISPETFIELKGELTPLQRLNVPARVLRTVEQINDVLEQTTKLTTFQRLRKNKQKVNAPNIISAIALNKPGAGKLAQDVIEVRRFGGSPDFAVKGAKGKELNLLFNFFTARVRGAVDDISRMKRIVTKDQRTDPETLRRARNGLAWATLFGTALYVWNNQFRDEDGTRAIDKVPNDERQRSYIFFLPVKEVTRDGDERFVYFSVPKPDSLRPVHAMIEAIYDQTLGSERSATQTALDIASEVAPISLNLEEGDVAASLARSIPPALNPVLGAPLEQIANVRFPGVPIVPRRLGDVAPTEQVRPTTSPTVAGAARTLSAIPGIGEIEIFTSPLRLEQLTRRFGGGIADQLLGAVDFVVRQGDPVKAARDVFGLRQRVRRVPIIGPIASRFIGSGRNRIRERKLRDLFRLAGDAREVANTFGNLERERPERSDAYILDDKRRLPLLLSNGELMTVTRDIAATRRAMDAVARDAEIDRPTKVGQLRQMNALLRELLDVEKPLSARVDKIAALDLTDEQIIQILELDRETKGRQRRDITAGLVGQ